MQIMPQAGDLTFSFYKMAEIKIKRIYQPAEDSDGFRILVDRLWPRGVRKEAIANGQWLKEIAPSTELRQWFHHNEAADRWTLFKHKYLTELKDNEAADILRDLAEKHGTITLLYSVPDEQHNHAVILKDFLENSQ